MKNKRILALLLSVCMLIVCLPGAVWAAGTTGNTLADLLGANYATRTTGFTQSITLTSGTSDSDKSKVSSQTPSDGVAALGSTGDAVEVSLHAGITVLDDDYDQNVQIQIYDSEGSRVYMGITELGAWIGNGEAIPAEHAAKLKNANVTLLFLNNESTYSVYIKESDGTYTHIYTTTEKRSGTAGTTKFQVSAANGATVSVSAITCYDSSPAAAAISSVLRRTDEVGVTGRTAGFYGSPITPKPLGSTGDSVEITLKANITVEGTNDQKVNIQVADADDNRAYMQIHETGTWISNSDSATMTFSATDTEALRNQKVTLKLLNKGTCYELSYKTADATEYTVLGTTTGKRSSGTDNRVIISPDGGATVDIESIKYYGAIPTPTGNIADSATKPEGCVESVSNGALSLSAGQSTTVSGAAIPMGGYADVKVKAAKALKVQNSDGTAGSDIHFVVDVNKNSSYYVQNLSVSKLKTAFVSGAEDKADVWHFYRIVRDDKNAAVYSVYHKTESDTTWTKVLADVDTTGAVSGINGMVFTAIDGAAQIEYLKVYTINNQQSETVLRRIDEVGVTGRTAGFYGASITPKPLGSTGDSVEITLKANITVEGDNNQNVTIQMPDADDNRVYMQIHEKGAWISNSDSATMTFSATDTADLRNQKVTLKLLNKGTCYELSYKTADAAQYTVLGTTTGKRSGGTASNISIVPSGGATVDIESIKYYGAIPTPTGNIADSATKPEGCVESASNGALSLSAGQSTTVNGAAIPMGGYADVKVKAAKALRMQNSDGAVGSDIHFVVDVNKNSSYYVQNLSASKLKSTFVSGAEDKADVWHLYRIVRDAENAAVYSVYHKTESDTTWTKVLTDVDTTGVESGIDGMVFEAIGGAAQIEYLKVYTKSNILDDPAIIAAENNKVWLDEDFAAADDAVTLNHMQIANGSLNANKLSEGTSGSAAISLADFDLDGEWYLKMTHRLEEGTSAASVVANGKRLRWTFAGTYSFIQADTGNFSVSHTRELGVWYEYLFYFDGNGSANIYYRKSGEKAWGVLATNVAMVDNSGAEELKFEAGASGAYKVDDLQIYTGIPVELGEPSVSGGTLAVTASASVGHPYSTYDRRATVIGATYNKEHGYTSLVDSQNCIMFLGKDTDLSTAFAISGVDMSQNEAAVMVWDSIDTSIPLVEPTGSSTPNNAEGRPAEGQESGLATKVSYNEVRITGLVGAEENIASVLLDGSGNVKAVAQTKANKYGLVDMLIAVDPVCDSGSYTLRIQHGNNVADDQTVSLNCADILTETPITDAASFKTFVLAYGSAEEKTLMEQPTFAEEAYARYLKVKGEETITDLYRMREVIDSAIANEKTERDLVSAVNQAVAEEKWSALETLILTTYHDYLTQYAQTMNITLASIQGVSSTKNLFMRMLNQTYLSAEDVINGYNAATAAQKSAEAQTTDSGNTYSPAGGGVSFGGGGGVTVSDEAQWQAPVPVGTTEAFTDLDSVDWAKDNILSLQERGILSGDGNGLFYPERNVTREEFLKLVMEATKIPTDSSQGTNFADVDESAWYAKYVLAAYENGIIQGISDTWFGIGENISRADMAVILKRAMNFCGVDTDTMEVAFVYDDFADIPEYAHESVFLLSEAGLMRGVGDNCFMPLAQATRAEAAVSIYRLCEYLSERR